MTMVSKQDSSERWSLVEHPFQLSRLERQDNISVTSVALPLTDQEHPSYSYVDEILDRCHCIKFQELSRTEVVRKIRK